MRKCLYVVAAVLLLQGCTISFTPLKGNYPGSYTVISDKSFEKVWSSIIDYCAKTGLGIKLIDKSSGILISEKYRFNSYTFENPDGTPQVSNAYFVVGCEKIENTGKCLPPTMIHADFNFRVKEEDGKTSLYITFTNIQAEWSFNTQTGKSNYLRDVKSTGVFEKQIAESLK